MRIPFCPWEAGSAPSQFANSLQEARQLEANDGEVEKRKRDKTWNDVAAAQKRGVELQGLSEATRHQLVSTEKGFMFRGLARADIVMGPTVEVMKEYCTPVTSSSSRCGTAPRAGRADRSRQTTT